MKVKLNIFSCLLLALIVVSNFQNQFVHLAFDLNKEIIIEKLCENKEEPEMQCEGKCYLSKQLNSSNETNSDERLTQIIYLNLPVAKTELTTFFIDTELLNFFMESYTQQIPEITTPPPRLV